MGQSEMSVNLAVDLDEVYTFAVQLGKDAGSLLMDGAHLRYGNALRSNHIEKESAVDLVTQTDEGEFRDMGGRGPLPVSLHTAEHQRSTIRPIVKRERIRILLLFLSPRHNLRSTDADTFHGDKMLKRS